MLEQVKGERTGERKQLRERAAWNPPEAREYRNCGGSSNIPMIHRKVNHRCRARLRRESHEIVIYS